MQPDDLEKTRAALKKECLRLHGEQPAAPADLFSRLAEWCRAGDIKSDCYGEGALIEDFERRVADLLGYPAARFMPSGTMAQLIALRIHAERAGLAHFGMHPTSHLELHEQRGYASLHGLRATLVGPADAPMLLSHLETVRESLAALLIELPIREAGGQLPTWEQLEELKAGAAERSLPLHLDGARLWECGPAYGRSLAEICTGFSSAYVSFYKGIGALSGSMLLGAEDFIEEAKIWQRRQGGNLYTLLPNVASAALMLGPRLERMPLYFERARELAAVMRAADGLLLLPDPPHVNMLHVFLPGAPEAALSARDQVAQETGLWLFERARAADVPGVSRFELYVGEAALELDPARVGAAFERLCCVLSGA